MFQLSGLNDKRIHELEFTFCKDCQQSSSYIGFNKYVKDTPPIFSLEPHVWFFDLSHMEFGIASWVLSGIEYSNYRNGPSG